MRAEFVIPGRPVPCPRPRVVLSSGLRPRRRAAAYYPVRYVDWIRAAKWEVRRAWTGRAPLTSPVAVDLVIAGAHQSADIDNLAKAVLDVMTDIVYVDDRQVVDLRVRLTREKPSGVRVEIEAPDPQSS